jgi:subtilisin family serine protease
MKPGVTRAAKNAQFADREVQDLTYLDSFVVNLTDAEVQAMRNDDSVRYVESADIKFFASDASIHPGQAIIQSPPIDAQVTPYGITMVHAPQVWPVAKGDGINVAIVDTGIDYTHPELKDRYQGGFNAIPIPNTNDPKDDEGHGTHVAGTIAAADNGIGVVGVAPNAKLWSAKVLAPDGAGSATGTNGQIAAGLNWVLSKRNELGGHWIVNMSLGQCTDVTVDPENCSATASFAIQSACQNLADAGVLVFAASGNDSTPAHAATVSYPAAFSSVIAVGAVDSTRTIGSFSNQGPELALSGPGIGVFSTYIVGQGTNSFVTNGSNSYDAIAVTGSTKGAPAGQYVYCGLGATAADFPASVNGKIDLIQRGGATFNAKTKGALAAGARAVVIYNCSLTASPTTCTSDAFGGWTLIGKLADGTTDNPADLTFNWPVTIGISLADGEALRATAAGSTLTETNVADDYATESGTSMACPHAVGVAALVWSTAPNASPADVKSALFNNAADLGASGRDNVYGYGLLDALAAAKQLNPAAFAPAPVTGRQPGRRGH